MIHTKEEAVLVVKRIQALSKGVYVPEEISHLAEMLEVYFEEPKTPEEEALTEFEDRMRHRAMEKLVVTMELSANDVLLLAHNLGMEKSSIKELTLEELTKVSEEADSYYQKGELEFYLNALASAAYEKRLIEA